MNRAVAMDNAEMKAMRATIRDGITELQLGSMLIVFGVLFYFASHLAALGALFQLLLIPLGKLLKRKYVYPRIGYAKVAQQPHAKRGIFITAIVAIVLILAALGIFVLILGYDPGFPLWRSHFIPSAAGVLMAIGPWVVARTYRLARWYAFAALSVLAGIGLPLLNIATGYAAVGLQSAFVGGFSLIYGVGLFFTFLSKYPIEESSSAGE